MSLRIVLVGTAAAALALTACSSSKSGTATTLPPAGGGTSSTAGSPQAGQGSTISAGPNGVLTAADGHTLYFNTVDSAGKIICTGACAVEWPPVPGPVRAGGGIQPVDLTTVSRPDGSLQAVYQGHPLYEFKGDTMAGDMKGNGFKDAGGTWQVAKSGVAASSSSSSSNSSSSGGGNGGY
jgi:predicted lipoprotein with Yx(FWY)xxD motif